MKDLLLTEQILYEHKFSYCVFQVIEIFDKHTIALLAKLEKQHRPASTLKKHNLLYILKANKNCYALGGSKVSFILNKYDFKQLYYVLTMQRVSYSVIIENLMDHKCSAEIELKYNIYVKFERKTKNEFENIYLVERKQVEASSNWFKATDHNRDHSGKSSKWNNSSTQVNSCAKTSNILHASNENGNTKCNYATNNNGSNVRIESKFSKRKKESKQLLKISGDDLNSLSRLLDAFHITRTLSSNVVFLSNGNIAEAMLANSLILIHNEKCCATICESENQLLYNRSKHNSMNKTCNNNCENNNSNNNGSSEINVSVNSGGVATGDGDGHSGDGGVGGNFNSSEWSNNSCSGSSSGETNSVNSIINDDTISAAETTTSAAIIECETAKIANEIVLSTFFLSTCERNYWNRSRMKHSTATMDWMKPALNLYKFWRYIGSSGYGVGVGNSDNNSGQNYQCNNSIDCTEAAAETAATVAAGASKEYIYASGNGLNDQSTMFNVNNISTSYFTGFTQNQYTEVTYYSRLLSRLFVNICFDDHRSNNNGSCSNLINCCDNLSRQCDDAETETDSYCQQPVDISPCSAEPLCSSFSQLPCSTLAKDAQSNPKSATIIKTHVCKEYDYATCCSQQQQQQPQHDNKIDYNCDDEQLIVNEDDARIYFDEENLIKESNDDVVSNNRPVKYSNFSAVDVEDINEGSKSGLKKSSSESVLQPQYKCCCCRSDLTTQQIDYHVQSLIEEAELCICEENRRELLKCERLLQIMRVAAYLYCNR